MFVQNENVKPQNVGNGVTRKILARGGSLMMVEVTFAKNAIGAEHTHIHEQISYVANGSFEFNLNGDRKVIKKGDTIYIEPNILHGLVSLENNSIIVDIFNPQREDFIAEEIE